MSHGRWVKLENRVKQIGAKSGLRLDEGRIAEREGVDQTGPGFEAADAAGSFARPGHLYWQYISH